MKKMFLYIAGGIIILIAIINFAAAINIYFSDSNTASVTPVDFCELNSSSLYTADMPPVSDIATITDSGLPLSEVSQEDRQINRYNIARFFKELKVGTTINSYTLSQHLDIVGIPYQNVKIVNDEIDYDDLIQMLAMSAVYTNYDADNISHFKNYARILWAYTHNITVNGNSYPARVIIDYADLVPAFYEDIKAEYDTNGSVTFHFTPVEGNYYELDPAENFTWSEDKIAEAELLKSTNYFTLVNYILKRNDESVLYSPLPLFNQCSSPWGDVQFGGGTINSDGCCPSAISMVLTYFKGERITPDIIATRYDTEDYRNVASGSYGAAMCRRAAADYGLNITASGDLLSAEQILAYLKDGCKIVMSVKGFDASTGTGGDYSSGFHYITLAGVTSDGYVIVNNPGYTTDITYDTAQKVAANQSGKCYAVFWE